MKTTVLIILCLSLFAASGFAQFKSTSSTSVSQSLVHPATSISSFLGFFDPNNFMMHHNFALSYMSAGGTGVSLASYTNSMFYKISDPLNVRFDVTLQGSPFSNGIVDKNSLNKLYISRAELNYHPSENTVIQVQYRELPYNYWGYNPYYLSPFAQDDK